MTRERLKEIRSYLGMSQKRFSEYIGVSESSIAMVEAGHREVTDALASKVAHKFTADADFIDYLDNCKKLGS